VTAVTVERPGACRSELTRETPSLFDGLGGEPTLDVLIAGAWEGLALHRSVACPLCGGELRPEYGANRRPRGGRCSSCDTRLS
jgi:hypothetical protein